MKVFDGKEGWKGRTILNKCYSDFLQEFRSLIKRKFTSVLKKIRQPKKNWHLNCLIIFKWSFLFDFKSSQFSHKQLVLVTAPVSTGAYFCAPCIPHGPFLLFLFYFFPITPKKDYAHRYNKSQGGADHICQDIFHIKVAAWYKIFLHILHGNSV